MRAVALSLAAALALSSVSVGSAQSVYMWRDERGVLNFSDQPPPTGVRGVEERVLEGRTPPVAGPTPAPAEGSVPGAAAGGEPGAARAGQRQPREEGPSRVVLARQEVEPVSPDVREVKGTVVNTGGTTARRVAVVYRITDPGQGTPCITGEIPVEPEDLEPRAIGHFAAFLETPCFRGNAGIELSPAWD